jgi:hypothetical protein
VDALKETTSALLFGQVSVVYEAISY